MEKGDSIAQDNNRGKHVASILLTIILMLTYLVTSTNIPNPSTAASNEPIPLTSDGGPEVLWNPITNGLPISGTYYGVQFGDINNDGKLDVAAGNGDDGSIDIFVNDGTNNFVEQSTGLPTTGINMDIVLADFNNDGNLDVAGSRLYLGNGGAGGSMSWTYDSYPDIWEAATAADINLDGNTDLVVGTNTGLRAWTGDGGTGGSIIWTDSSNGLPQSDQFWGTAVGDVNHDGMPDIVCANPDDFGGIIVYTGNGGSGPAALWTNNSTGLPITDSYANVDVGDINNDGNLDIVSTGYFSAGPTGTGVRAWLGNGGAGGSMVWTESSNGLLVTGSGWLGVAFFDANNDGNLDITAAHWNNIGVKVWLGDGGAGGAMDWIESSEGFQSARYVDLDVGDYNNDGKVDIVTGLDGGIQIWENVRPDFVINGYSSMSTGLPTSDSWRDIIFGDVNIDGKLDLAVSSASNLGVRVYAGDGTGVWTSASTGLPNTGNYNGLRFADFNYDGKLDLAAGNNGGSGVFVWLGDGTGSWSSTPVNPISGSTYGGGLEVSDVDDDGNLDLITCYWIVGANGPIYVWLGDGAGGFGSNTGPAEGGGYDDVAVNDINHDANPDIIATGMNNSMGNRFWLGNGSGGWILQPANGLLTSGVYLGAALGNVDHDGNQDLAIAAYGPGEGMHVLTSDGGAGGAVNWIEESSGLPLTGDYAGVEFDDLDIDGNLDIVYSSQSAGIGIGLGNGGAGGAMTWIDGALPNLPSTGQYWGIALADVNNDGKLEIGTTKNGGVEVWRIDMVTSGNQPLQLVGGQVSPLSGNQGTTFTYNVTYRDADNNPPLPAPYVSIRKGGVPYSSSPYVMVPQNWIGPPGNYSVGRNYNFSISISDCGSDYTFSFNASDGTDDVVTSGLAGPSVNCIPESRDLQVQGCSDASAGIMHITNHAPDLSWTFYDVDLDTQSQYQVRVGSSSGMSDMWASGTQIGETTTVSYAGAPLLDGTDYWFGARVNDGSAWSPWNETRFHMNSLPPAATTPIIPADDSNVPSSPSQSLDWTSGGADPEGDLITYYWYIDLDNPPVAPFVANGFTTTTSSTSFSTSSLTDYYWYVNATDGWEWAESILWNFTTSSIINNPPEARDLTVQAFSEGSAGISNITDHTPLLAWSYFDPESAPQTQYQARLGSASGQNDIWAPGVQVGAGTSTIYSGALLLDGTDYWFGTRVYDGTIWSSWNETQFHMNTVPPSPTTPNPADGSTGLAPGSQIISWNAVTDAEGSSLTYYWYVSTDAVFTIVYDNGTTSMSTATVATAISSTYYWRVRANDGYEFGSNSTTWNFSTNNPSTLDWTGEVNYINDGVDPNTGDPTTDFEFRVKYSDQDNHTGIVRIIILEGGSEISNETMDEVDPGDLDRTDGKLYALTLQLNIGSYLYYFYASDSVGAIAVTTQSSLSVSATTGTIRGTVVTEGDVPVEGADVYLVKNSIVIMTDATNDQGAFEFQDVEYGEYDVVIMKEGFYDKLEPADLDQPLLDLGPIIISKPPQSSEFPWWIILLIILMVIIIILSLLLLFKRRKKKEEDEIPKSGDYLATDQEPETP